MPEPAAGASCMDVDALDTVADCLARAGKGKRVQIRPCNDVHEQQNTRKCFRGTGFRHNRKKEFALHAKCGRLRARGETPKPKHEYGE